MKQRIVGYFVSSFVSLMAALMLLAGFTQSAFAEEIIPGEYLVSYKGQAFTSMTSIRSLPMVRVMDHNPYGQLIKVQVSRLNEYQTLARLLADPNVASVTPNIRVRAFTAPLDMQALKQQWAIQKVNAEAAWKRAGNKGSKNVIVAVIDTGVDYRHESLQENMVEGFDFKDNDKDPYDTTGAQNPGHGTHCAGIIGATGVIDGGVVGISPEVSIMPLRFLGEDGSGDLNAAIKAIDHAIQNGAKVISASWGATIRRSLAQPLIEAVKRADDAGVAFVVAAANDGRNNDVREVFPANAGFPNTISVAASGPNDEKPTWSNYGRGTVHVAAPGLDIMSTLPDKKYGNLSGTSMATPLVSGLVAFLMSQDDSLTGAQARALLQVTGAKAEIETACDCRVDALAAVDTLLTKKMFVTPAAATVLVGEKQAFTATFGKAPFAYSVANKSVGTIDKNGMFSAVKEGDTTITVQDSAGAKSTSLAVRVIPESPVAGGDCPLGDQQICDVICQMQPELPICL